MFFAEAFTGKGGRCDGGLLFRAGLRTLCCKHLLLFPLAPLPGGRSLAPPPSGGRLGGGHAARPTVSIAGYTVLVTVFLPEYWLHPYGPIGKNLPIMAAIALPWGMEPRQR